MKQIVKNKYLKSYKFSSYREMLFFMENQNSNNCLFIKDGIGDNYYCYICCDSLTNEKRFVLSFSSEDEEDALNFLFWDERNVLVLDNGKNIYLIDENLSIRATFDLTTPLIGLHLINSDRLLLLEEAYMRIINSKGEVLESLLFDLIEKYSIKGNYLSIQTSDDCRVIDLR